MSSFPPPRRNEGREREEGGGILVTHGPCVTRTIVVEELCKRILSDLLNSDVSIPYLNTLLQNFPVSHRKKGFVKPRKIQTRSLPLMRNPRSRISGRSVGDRGPRDGGSREERKSRTREGASSGSQSRVLTGLAKCRRHEGVPTVPRQERCVRSSPEVRLAGRGKTVKSKGNETNFPEREHRKRERRRCT